MSPKRSPEFSIASLSETSLEYPDQFLDSSAKVEEELIGYTKDQLSNNPIEAKGETVKEEVKEKELIEYPENGSLSQAYNFFRKKIIPAVLEGSQLSWKVFNSGVDFTAQAIDYLVPSAVRAVTGFVLPSHVDRALNTIVEKGTRLATFVGKNFAKISVNVFTFGAPAWIDAFRSGLAVKDANEKLQEIKSGNELAAFSFLEHLKDRGNRTDLEEYYGLREQLMELRKNPEGNKEKIFEVAEKIACLEIKYKDNTDFLNLKGILEKGQEFIHANEHLINQLAEESADRMIASVENYYKDTVSGLAGKVEGKWLGIITSPELGRSTLVRAIAERLRGVMNEGMNDEKTKQELNNINRELISAFGVYRKFLKASIYLILKDAMPVVKEGLDSVEAWDAVSRILSNGRDYIVSGLKQGIEQVASWIWNSIKDELLNAFSGLGDNLRQMVEVANQAAIENAVDNIGAEDNLYSNNFRDYLNRLNPTIPLSSEDFNGIHGTPGEPSITY